MPETAQLHLELDHGAGSDIVLFAAAHKAVPLQWPGSSGLKAISEKDRFVVSIDVGTPIREASFFPLDPEQIENTAPQQLQPTARGATIILKKSDQLLKPISVLRGVLVVPESIASYRVDIPVTQR